MNRNLLFLIVIVLFSGSWLESYSQTTVSQVAKIDTVLSGIQSIEMDVQFCKVDIEPAGSNELSIQGTLNSDKLSSDYKFELSGDQEIIFKVTTPATGWQSHNGTLVIKLPLNVNLKINSSSGVVAMRKLKNNNGSIVTKSGNIDLIDCEGDFTLESATGVVKTNGHKGQLQTKTKSGSQLINNHQGTLVSESTEGTIDILSVKGSVNTESTVGNQTIQRVDGPVKAKAVNGNVKIAESTGEIKVVTFAGQIKLHNTTGIVNLQSTAGDQVGVRLNLTGSSSFQTTEGKIKMQIDNKTDELTFNLQSTTAFIQARGTSKKKKLKMGKGAIIVQGISTTGGQVYN